MLNHYQVEVKTKLFIKYFVARGFDICCQLFASFLWWTLNLLSSVDLFKVKSYNVGYAAYSRI